MTMFGVKKGMTPQLLRIPEISVPTTSIKAGLRIVDRPDGDAEPAQDSEFQREPQNAEVFAEQAEAHSKSIPDFSNRGIEGEVFRVAENQHWNLAFIQTKV
ncbi:hypothetical protein PHMEG_00010785 [Phytophthora megakarya]|uniref:Uncharacterized protein n=1 Tax=Phytophthora megakarya TaxID=4795 RepID=A0A225WDT1_9STRA|nr:hypothetical protein PHMEG_00010785 [Phytophthora megakarya]